MMSWLSRRDAATQMEAMSSVGTLFSIVHRTSSATADPTWRLYRRAKSGLPEDRQEVTSHAALDLWKQPNPWYTTQELVESGQQHVDLTGEGWLVIGRNARSSIPLELWLVRPDRIAPVPSTDRFMAGYIYSSPDGEQIPLDVDQVLSIRVPNPMDPYRGMGAVQAVLADLDSDRYASEWNRNFFLNSAEPGGVIEVPQRLDDGAWRELVTRWRESHQGVARAHRVAVIENGKWVPRTFSMRDMQFAELRNVSRDKIMEAFGISKFALGILDDVNRASAEAAADWFARNLTIPRLKRWRALLNNDLLPLYGTAGQGLEFDFDSPVSEDSEAADRERTGRATTTKTYIDAGFKPASGTKVMVGDLELVYEEASPEPAPEAPDGQPAVDAVASLGRSLYAPAVADAGMDVDTMTETVRRLLAEQVRNHPGHSDQSVHGRPKRSGQTGTGPIRGTDMLDGRSAEAVAGRIDRAASKQQREAGLKGTELGGPRGDSRLSAIQREQGFDGKPAVVSRQEMDRLVADGHQECFRGFGGLGDGSKTEAQVVQEFTSGPLFTGYGTFGNGAYVAPGTGGRAVAERYSDSETPTRMALHKDAKVASYRAIVDEMEARGLTSRRGVQGRALADPGRYAAARGYDAIRVEANDSICVLNRTALFVEEA
jgi:HK97 family phage portal protein